MKFTDRGNNNYTIEGIKRKDIKYTNLAAGPTKSIYYDPDRPQHVYVIWLDEETADDLVAAGFNVSQAEDTFNDLGTRPFIQFKAYPKMRLNRITGREEQHPKVIMMTSTSTIRLTQKSFGLLDSAQIKNADISFHSWSYDDKRKPVAVLDGIWCTADETAGGRNNYFDESYGYEEPTFEPDNGDEEVPFQ